jgi:hypothetical protein
MLIAFALALVMGYNVGIAVDPNLPYGVLGANSALIGFVASLLLSIVLHEVGHVVGAWLMGLPVARVEIGRVNRVTVRPAETARALPLRMVLFALAGPAANLAMAFALYRIPPDALPPPFWAAPLGGALAAAAFGLMNLVPLRTDRAGYSDGTKIIWWQFRVAFARAQLAREYRAARIAAGAEDDGLSQTIEATEDPAVLVAAITRRWETRQLTVEDLVAGLRQFAAMAQRPGITPEVKAAVAGYLARASAVRLLSAALREGRPASLPEADRVVALAEVSYRDSPGQSVARITLASALLLRGRAEETRKVLSYHPRRGDSAEEVQDAAIVDAIAAIYLDDLEEADRLTRAAAQTGCAQEDLDLIAAARSRPPLCAPEPAVP